MLAIVGVVGSGWLFVGGVVDVNLFGFGCWYCWVGYLLVVFVRYWFACFYCLLVVGLLAI